MKVLMIAPEPFFEPRGTPISVYSRLRMLAHIGYEVDLLTYPVGIDVQIPGVNIHRTISLPFIRRVKVGPSWPKLLLDLLLFVKAVRLLLTTRYDVIHSHEEAAFFCMVLAWVFRTRHIYDMHSSLPRQLANFNFGNIRPVVALFAWFERRVIRTSAAVITVGADLDDYIHQVYADVYCTNIENLPVHEVVSAAGDQRAQPSLPPGAFPIVYTGTLELYQGLELILEKAGMVLEACPEALFVIVGGSPDQVDYWRQFADSLSLDGQVLFTGRVSLEESIDYLALAEILVSPRIDGTSVPLKIYSYMYAGKPIVATNIYAHSQILDDDTAVLVAPEPLAFAEGLIRLAQSPELRRRLGANAARVAAERYNLDQQAAKLKHVYETVMSSG